MDVKETPAEGTAGAGMKHEESQQSLKEMLGEEEHDAFISYSRRNGDFAKILEESLESYKPPKISGIPQRALQIFLDVEDIKGNELDETLKNFIKKSSKLILLCSPDSAKSPYVHDEIELFAKYRGAENIIPVLIEGKPRRADNPKQTKQPAKEAPAEVAKEDAPAFPWALCKVLKHPRATDYRGFPKEEKHLSKGGKEQEWSELLASIYDLDRRVVEEREKKKYQSRMRKIIASAAIIIIGLLIFALNTLSQNYKIKDLKFYSNNFFQAKTYEEKAGGDLQSQGIKEQQRAWLYTLAALGQDIDPQKKPGLNVSRNRLIRQAMAADVYQQTWVSPGALNNVFNIAISPGGKELALATNHKNIRLCDLQSGEELPGLIGHEDMVLAVAFSPNSARLTSASADSTVRLWELGKDSLLNTLRGHKGPVVSVAFSPDGKYLASGSEDKTIRLWNAGSGAFIDSLTGHRAAVVSLAFGGANGRFLASASKDGAVRLWEWKNRKGEIIGESGSAGASVAFSPAGKLLAFPSANNAIQVWDVENGRPLISLSGHQGAIECLAFGPRDSLLASASGDNNIRLWDTRSGKLEKTLAGHSNNISSMVFTPDGKRLISASRKGSVRLWDVESGSELAVTAGHVDNINSIAFSRDMKYLASGADDATAILWDVGSGAELRKLRGHAANVLSVAFGGPGGNLLASASKDNTIRLWDIETGAVIRTLTGHTNYVRSVAFSPEDTVLASASRDKTIRLWNANTGAPLAVLAGHEGDVWTIAFRNPGGKFLISGSRDNTLCLWDISAVPDANSESVKRIRWRAHSDAIWCAAFSPDGKKLASGSKDELAYLWDVDKLAALLGYEEEMGKLTFASQEEFAERLKEDAGLKSRYIKRVSGGLPRERNGAWRLEHSQGVLRAYKEKKVDDAIKTVDEAFIGYIDDIWSVTVSSKGEFLACRFKGNKIELKSGDKKVVDALRGHEDDIWSVAFSSDNRILASASDDETIRLWDVKTGNELAVLEGHGDDVSSLAFGFDSAGYGSLLASASWDKTIRFWNIKDGINLDTVFTNADTVRSVAFSPDGNYLAYGGHDHRIHLRNVSEGKEETIDYRYRDWSNIMSVAFSPNDTSLAYGSADDRIRFVRNYKNLMEKYEDRNKIILLGHKGDGLCVAFSPDSAYLASGSSDGQLRVWNLKNNFELTTLPKNDPRAKAHHDKVRSLAFSPDSKYLASGSSDRSIHLWNLDSLDRAKSFHGHTDGVWGLAFSPDGRLLASGSWDQSIRLWDVNSGEVTILRGHRDAVMSLAFSPDGRLLASGSRDRTIRVWDVQTAKEVDIIRGYKGDVTTVAFSPGGTLLASGSKDYSVRIRNLNYLHSFETIDRDSLHTLLKNDSSLHLQELLYIKEEEFSKLDSSYLPYKSVFDAYAHLYSYQLHSDFELSEEPRKFRLIPADTSFFSQPCPYRNLHQPRPANISPVEWILRNVEKNYLPARHKPKQWLFF